MSKQTLKNPLIAILWAVLLASLISAFGAGVWTALISINLALTPAIPWSVPAMAVVLWLMWQYLNGKGWPRSTSAARHAYLRSNPVPRSVWAWALAAGVTSLVALAGFWIVLVELTGAGGNPTIPSYAQYPIFTVVLGLIMGSLVSPITEEAAFRGYSQVIIRRALPTAAAIVISSVLFALWHGPTQGFAWSKLLFYFSVGVVFGTIAELTHSVLPAIPVHILGDLTFFFLIWPFDATRPLIWRDGADLWFWLHAAQAIVFTILAVLLFRVMAGKANSPQRIEATDRPVTLQ